MDKHKDFLDPWSKLYPIVSVENPESQGITHYIYINTYIESPDEFSEIIALLDTVPENELVIFKLNSGGGYLNSALMIIDAIRSCEARVVAELSGEVASATTMLALACDDIYVAPYTTFMIHNFSGGAGGKGHEIASNVEFMLASNKDFFNDTYKGFLTKKEIKAVINGKDIYLTSEEVYERFDKVKVIHEKKQVKLQKSVEKEQEAALVELVESLGFTMTKKEDDAK